MYDRYLNSNRFRGAWRGSDRTNDDVFNFRAGHVSPPAETNLQAIRGRRLLALVDADNWDFSLNRQGLRLRYRLLLNRLESEAAVVFPVAVLAAAPGDNTRARYLRSCGWRVLSIEHETVTTHRGQVTESNADFDICFEAGVLANLSDCDAAILGTGDGQLAVSLARNLLRVCPRMSGAIHALSVAGTGSARLRNRAELFQSALSIGTDLTEVLAAYNLSTAIAGQGACYVR